MGEKVACRRRTPNVLWLRPAAGAAVFLILGILLHRVLPARPAWWLGVAFAAALAGAVLARWTFPSSAALAVAVVALGAALAQQQAFFYPADHIALFASDGPRLAQIELKIDQPPRVLGASISPGERIGPPVSPRQVMQAKLQRILTTSGWRPASGRVLLQIDRPDDRLELGQTIRVLGMLDRPAPAANPAQFDWAGYYRDDRILASVSVARAENVQIIAPAGFEPLGRMQQWARSVLGRGFSQSNSLDHALLQALLLGDPDPQLRDVQDQFVRTGTSHHLAISGMHVAIVGFAILLVFRVLRRPPRISAVVMMAFVVLYGLVALPSAPVWRSVLLCIGFGVGVVGRRNVNGVQLLMVSVLLLLLWNPLDLYNAGFELSFGTVLGLMLMAAIAMRWINGERGLDEMIAESVRPIRGWGLVGRWLKRASLEALVAGCVAWLVSAPLIARHFEQLNPWAIIASIAMAPVVLAGLIGGLLKIVLTLLVPPLAGAWATMAAAPMAAMRWMVDLFARFPGSDIPLPSPPLWLVLVYFGLLLLPLLPLTRPRLRWGLRCGPVAAALLALCLPFLVGFRLAGPRSGELRVTLLSVGAGQCAVVETPSGQVVLIDAGASFGNSLARNCIRPYLRHIGRSSIDEVFLSHPNYDHYSAVADLCQSHRIGAVCLCPRFAEESVGNQSAEATLEAIAGSRCPMRNLYAGERIALDDVTTIEVVWPPAERNLKPNDDSLVLRLVCRGRSILFTGDIQQTVLRELSADPRLVGSDVLIAPHHGSCEPATGAFVSAVDPRWILSSNDRTLTRKQREFDRVAATRPVYRTDRSGAITVTVDSGGKLNLQCFLPPP